MFICESIENYLAKNDFGYNFKKFDTLFCLVFLNLNSSASFVEMCSSSGFLTNPGIIAAIEICWIVGACGIKGMNANSFLLVSIRVVP